LKELLASLSPHQLYIYYIWSGGKGKNILAGLTKQGCIAVRHLLDVFESNMGRYTSPNTPLTISTIIGGQNEPTGREGVVLGRILIGHGGHETHQIFPGLIPVTRVHDYQSLGGPLKIIIV